jgi:hypothetical protein
MTNFKELEAEAKRTVVDHPDPAKDTEKPVMPEEKVRGLIAARQMFPMHHATKASDLADDVYDGFQPRVERGSLGLNNLGNNMNGMPKKPDIGLPTDVLAAIKFDQTV